jgi:hypothetical protein
MLRNTLLLVAGVAVSVATAQDIVSARAGLIHHMEGSVLIDGTAINQVGDQFVSMKQGQTLSTEQGRAEVLLNAGTYLRIGESSSFKLVSADLANTQLTLLSGTVLIEVADLPKDTSATLDIMGSQVALRKRGLYEFTANKPGIVRVYDGELALTASGARPIKIGKGREIAFNALAAGPGKFDENETSELYNWGSRRALYIARANQSAARSAYADASNGVYNQSMLTGLGSYRGVWMFNPYFGIYTYLPMRGYGYSPYGIQIYSPQTAYVQVYQPVSAGYDNSSNSSRGAVSAPAYSGSSVNSSPGNAAPAAVAAPVAASPDTGGGGDAGRRR